MKKKILSIILAAVMLVAALPFNAFALSYGTQAEVTEENRTIGMHFCGFAGGANNITTGINYNNDGETVKSLYSTNEDKLTEIKAVVDNGYVNHATLPLDENLEKNVELFMDNNIDFWISVGKFDSSRKDLERYVNDAEYWINRIRAAGGYDNFLGFWWDEPMLNGMTNDDLYNLTKALYEKWGKRNYIVETPSVYIKNENSAYVEGSENVEWITDKTLTYITDIAYDSYSWDVRSKDDLDKISKYYYTTQQSNLAKHQAYQDGKYSDAQSYYKYLTEIMCDRIENVKKDMYVWFYPAAYNTTVYTSNKRADEAYCKAHFDFFKDILLNIETEGVNGKTYQYVKAGGITLYSYSNFKGKDGTKGTTDDTVGLSTFLPIEVTYDKVTINAEGKPETATVTEQLDGGWGNRNASVNEYVVVPGSWNSEDVKYADTIKDTKLLFDGKTLSALDDNVPFGSLDVADATHNTITINANDGYEYSIDGGAYQTSGKFTGLAESTDYTITVKRTSDGETKDFAVSTTARYPYSTGLDDTASYIMKLDTSLKYFTSDYGSISTTLSRNIDNTDFYGNANGYLHIVSDGDEKFIQVMSNGSDGNATLNFSFGDKNRSEKDTGLPKEILGTTNAFAIRMKIEGGTEDQLSMFDFYINCPAGQKRSDKASSYPIKFLDKETLNVTTLTYKNGIQVTGEVDGWIIIPYNAYPDLDGDSSTSNAEWIKNGITHLQIWIHNGSKCTHYATGSDWTDKQWYIGDVMCVENTDVFLRARQGLLDYPAGTVGYFMDVPEEEQYIPQKVDGVQCLGYTQWLFVANNAKTAADPFSDSLTDDDSYFDKNNGGLFVRVIDGEEFMILNPIENVTADYNTTSEKVTTETTAEDGTVTKFNDNVVTGTTNIKTSSGKRNRHIGQIYYNGISSIDNTSITSDVSGLPLVSNDREADITHLAFRIKVIGGHKDQKSAMWTPETSAKLANYCSDIYFVDVNTGEIIKNIASDVIVLPFGDFDGYMVTPIDLANLQASQRINLYTFAESSTDWKSSDWAGRVLCMGDAYAVTDSDAFAAQFKPETVPTLDFTVTPEANNKLVVTNDTDPDKKVLYSVDGENWYDVDAFNALTFEGNKFYTVYAKYSWLTNAAIESKTVFNADDTATDLMIVKPGTNIYGYNSATYGVGGMYWSSGYGLANADNTGFSTNENGGYLHATEVDNEYYWEVKDNPDVKCHQLTIAPLYGEKVGNVYENAAEKYSYITFRIRIEDDGTGTAVEGATYPMSVSITNEIKTDNNYHKWKNTGAYFYDIATGEKFVVNAGSYSGPSIGFNGYLVFPSSAVIKGTTIQGDNPDTEKVETSYNVYEFSNASDVQRVQFYMHDKHSNDNHWGGELGDWTGTTLYIGDMELIEDDKAFLDARSNCTYTGIHDIQAVEAKAPSADDAGYFAHYACVNCGATYSDDKGTTEVNPELLAFDAASLTLEQNIAVNFKANELNLAGYTDVYAKFTFNGIEKIVKAGEPNKGKYTFTFDGIGPQLLGKTITAQLFGTYEGTVYSGAELKYSVKDYCYNMLAEYESVEGTKAQAFRTLLVDLLNYGAKAQLYTKTDVLDLVSENLGHIGTINRTVSAPDITEGTRGIYDDLADEDTLATWKGVNLYFEEVVGLKFRFTAESTDGLTVKVTDAKDGVNVLKEITNFTVSDKGGYIAYFDGLNATEMRKTVYVAVYKNGEKVSDTLAYDIVSYARGIITRSYVSERVTYVNEVKKGTTWPGDPYKDLKILVSYMLRYGDAAKAYVAA